PRPPGKRRVDLPDLLVAQADFPRGRILLDMRDDRRLRYREDALAPDEECQRDLSRRRAPGRGNLVKHLGRAESLGADRTVRDDGDPLPFAPRQHRVLDRPLVEIVENLIAADPA